MKPPAHPRYPNARRAFPRARAGLVGATALTAILTGGLLLAPAANAAESRENPPASQPAAEEPASTPSGSSAPAVVQSPHTDPPASVSASAEYANSVTTLQLLATPRMYGDIALLQITVELDGPANLSGMSGTVDIGGSVVASGTLIYAGSGRFSTIAVISNLSAGTHQLVARFHGTEPTDSGMPGARASSSAPLTVTLAKVPTTTTITAAPTTTRAFAPMSVAATVTASREGVAGTVSLLADDVVIGTAPVDSEGKVRFNGVVAPYGTVGLTARYDGDQRGNFTTSVSAVSPIVVIPLATRTDLRAHRATVRADEPAVFTGIVTNTDDTDDARPSGSLSVLVDGKPAYALIRPDTVSSGARETRFEVTVPDLALGEHEIAVLFEPESGFAASASWPATVTVTAVETFLSPSASEVQGTEQAPASVDVFAWADATRPEPEGPGETGPVTRAATVDVDAAKTPVDGYVQAFVQDTPFGDPVRVIEGRATLTFAGLAAGRHELDLRFTPDRKGFLRSSASVRAVIAETVPTDGGGTKPIPSGTGGTTPAPIAGPATLPQTGSTPLTSFAFGGGVLLLAGTAAVAAGRLRRRTTGA